MKWILASERLPDTEGQFFIKQAPFRMYFNPDAEFKQLHNIWIDNKYEWLDETQPLPAGNVEEAILEIIKEESEKSNVRKYTCINGFGYSQFERNIADRVVQLFSSQSPVSDAVGFELVKKAFFGTLGVQEEPFRNNYTWEEFMLSNGIYPNKPLRQSHSNSNEGQASQSSGSKSEWRRVEDGFPEDGHVVLCYEPEWKTVRDNHRRDGDWVKTVNGSNHFTHWMPLPAPPQQ